MRRILIVILLSVAVFSDDQPKIPDADKLTLRELQLTVTRADLMKSQLQKQWEAIDKQQKDAQGKLDRLAAALTEKYCKGGTLQDDLTCKMPEKPKPKEPETP